MITLMRKWVPHTPKARIAWRLILAAICVSASPQPASAGSHSLAGVPLAEGISALGDGRYLVVAAGGPALYMADAGASEPTRSMPPSLVPPATFLRPVDVSVRGDRAYVLDRFAPKIVVLALDARGLDVVAAAPLPFARDPEAIEALPDGGFLVLDAGRNEILVLDEAFHLARTIGHQGGDATGINCPHDFAIGRDGVIYVADSGNRRIQRYRLDGTSLGPWGRRGDGPGEFNNPTGVALDEDGNLIVVDHYRHSFQVLDTLSGSEFVERRYVLPEDVRYPVRLAVLPGRRCVFTCPQLSEVWEMDCP